MSIIYEALKKVEPALDKKKRQIPDISRHLPLIILVLTGFLEPGGRPAPRSNREIQHLGRRWWKGSALLGLGEGSLFERLPSHSIASCSPPHRVFWFEFLQNSTLSSITFRTISRPALALCWRAAWNKSW